ncbi:MAG TPA: cytidylate kinase family protein [Methanothrix sp.]|nr:cytidylate kinase family protein [Methanothrix sp.]
MIITISGAPGTGTSTLSRLLSSELSLRYVNSGDLFRKIASERNISVKEMNRLAEKGPEIDYLIDDAQKALAKEGGGIFEGRLSGHLLPADLRVCLKTDLRKRAERISKREAKLIEDAMSETRQREESEARRYKMYYNIEISDLSVYDLVLDTGKFNEAATMAVVLAAVRSLPCR